jgi:hypothetical protein
MWLIVRLALVAWALLLFSLTASGQSPPIKIGLLFPYTGPIATIGQDATKASSSTSRTSAAEPVGVRSNSSRKMTSSNRMWV